MSLWSRLFGWQRDAGDPPPDAEPEPEEPETNTIEFPTEPFVFECKSCGKVFEFRRKRAQCPECDSTDVSLMSE